MIDLKSSDGKAYSAHGREPTLPNNLSLSYGAINALVGDFYASIRPISDGISLDQHQQFFLDA